MARSSTASSIVSVGYTTHQKGDDIQEHDVIRARNGKWYTAEEIAVFHHKSRANCPTYGTCTLCCSAGPVGQQCESCGESNGKFVVIYHRGIWRGPMMMVDSENIAKQMEKTTTVAKADCTFDWIDPPKEVWTTDKHILSDKLPLIMDDYTPPLRFRTGQGPNIPTPRIIVRGYKLDHGYRNIDAFDLIRARTNGSWYTTEEMNNWVKKSVARCPTYGTCESCYRAGPMGDTCESCPNYEFKMIRLVGEQFPGGLVLDSAKIQRIMNKQNEVFPKAKANRTYAWFNIPTSNWNQHWREVVQNYFFKKNVNDTYEWDPSFFNRILGYGWELRKFNEVDNRKRSATEDPRT